MSEPTRAIEFRAADDARIDPGDWAARAAAVERELEADGIAAAAHVDALLAFAFSDDAGRVFSYTGEKWFAWTGSAWAEASPPDSLRLYRVPFELAPDPGPERAIPAAEDGGFHPSHLVAPTGQPAWPSPDPTTPPVPLPANLEVDVAEWRETGWARIVASNGWTGWIDGRLLRPVA